MTRVSETVRVMMEDETALPFEKPIKGEGICRSRLALGFARRAWFAAFRIHAFAGMAGG